MTVDSFTWILKLKKLLDSHLEMQRLKRTLQRPSYSGSALGRRILGAAIASAPALSFTAAEIIIPLIIASVFADASIELDLEQLTMAMPCATALKTILFDSAADSLLEAAEEIGYKWK